MEMRRIGQIGTVEAPPGTRAVHPPNNLTEPRFRRSPGGPGPKVAMRMTNEPAVPLPDAVQGDPTPPDETEVRTIARGLLGAVSPSDGPTPVQDVLITAFCRSMAGLSVDLSTLDPLEPKDFAPTLAHR